MSAMVAAITQFCITLICALEIYVAFQKRHHRVFFCLFLSATLSLIFGLRILRVI